MKILFSSIIVLLCWSTTQAQQSTPPPPAPPVAQPTPTATPTDDAQPTQPAPNQATETQPLSGTQSNRFATGAGAGTNALSPTGRFLASAPTGTNAQDQLQLDLSVTNSLATLPLAHSNSVVQLQTQLVALQNVTISIGSIQNVNINLHQNPQVQQHVRQLSTQIGMLAQGSTRPSQVTVQRLASDLVLAVAPARLPSDRMLVLAVVINQIVNGQQLTSDQLNHLIFTTSTALRTAGVPLAAAHPVTCDLHSIAYEIQPGLAQ